MWECEIEFCKRIAVQAGRVVLQIYNGGDYGVEYKRDKSPLTDADKRANEIIVESIKREFPKYAILSEEEQVIQTDRLQNDYCYIIDPLDGTKEFIKRNGQFTVNIALSYRHESVLGVIYVPVTGYLYFASKGMGAYCQVGEKIKRIGVSDKKENIRFVTSLSHGCEQWENFVGHYGIASDNIVKVGSSIKGCYLAEGRVEAYYRFNPTKEWDTAAMQCIIEEAGGIFRQMDGTRMLYNRENVVNDKGFYAINCEENLFSNKNALWMNA